MILPAAGWPIDRLEHAVGLEMQRVGQVVSPLLTQIVHSGPASQMVAIPNFWFGKTLTNTSPFGLT